MDKTITIIACASIDGRKTVIEEEIKVTYDENFTEEVKNYVIGVKVSRWAQDKLDSWCEINQK